MKVVGLIEKKESKNKETKGAKKEEKKELEPKAEDKKEVSEDGKVQE